MVARERASRFHEVVGLNNRSELDPGGIAEVGLVLVPMAGLLLVPLEESRMSFYVL